MLGILVALAAEPTVTAQGNLEEMKAWLNRPYPAESYRASEQLGVAVELADDCSKAIELIYQRRYPEAKRLLDELQKKYPTIGIGPFGTAMIYQALMFENFDFRYEKQYEGVSQAAKEQLQAGLKLPGDEAIERFFLAAITGVDSIHAIRKGELLPALDKALTAMNELKKVQELAPNFIDATLGDGLYLYWRSSLTESSKILPDFPDQRAAGIDLMKKVEREGIYLGFGASLALAYSYLDQKENRLALDRSLYIRARYPDNVVNNMTLARIYTIYQRFEDALRLYEEVLVDDPDNQRSWYHKGVVLTRLGRFSEAQSALDHYLGFAEIPVDARAQAWYRIGLLKARQGATDAARTAFEESIRIHNNPSARRALARLNAGKLFAPAEEEAP